MANKNIHRKTLAVSESFDFIEASSRQAARAFVSAMLASDYPWLVSVKIRDFIGETFLRRREPRAEK